MITVLAIDQGYSMGYAVLSQEMDRPHSGTLELRIPPQGNSHGNMLRMVRNEVTQLINQHMVTTVGREGMFIAKKNSKPRTVLPRAFITGVVEMAAADCGRPCQEVPVHIWRRSLFGVSHAPKGITCTPSDWWKAQAFNYCDRLGWETLTDDEADACCIADHLLLSLDAEYRAARKAAQSAA